MHESLATALRELTNENGGCWLGGEEQLIEELQRRVGSRATNLADSPSSLLDLQEYMALASGAFDELDLDLLDYRELSDDPLRYWREEVTYLPGASRWGPESPMLVCRRSRVPTVEYYPALRRILEHWDPFPLSLLLFAEGDDFGPASRWVGTSFELVRVLRAYYPTFDNVSYDLASLLNPPDVTGCLPDYENIHEYGRLFELLPKDDYSPFNERMLASVPILREVGIRVRQMNRSEEPRGDDHSDPSRTEWIIEALRWDNPDFL